MCKIELNCITYTCVVSYKTIHSWMLLLLYELVPSIPWSPIQKTLKFLRSKCLKKKKKKKKKWEIAVVQNLIIISCESYHIHNKLIWPIFLKDRCRYNNGLEFSKPKVSCYAAHLGGQCSNLIRFSDVYFLFPMLWIVFLHSSFLKKISKHQ